MVAIKARELLRRVEEVESQIERSIRNSPVWQARRELLESMPAIGKVNSGTLLERIGICSQNIITLAQG